MGLLKKIGWGLLIILVILGFIVFVFVNSLAPNYQGQEDMPGLSTAVKVYYDNYGIPHIYGQNEKDAFRVLGYVHAQDRLW
ncbi:MAG: penicillin acylase family protein, partial [Bacteroidota bacterium]